MVGVSVWIELVWGLTLIKSCLVPSKQQVVRHNQPPGVILFHQCMKIHLNGMSPYGGSSCATFHSSLIHINTCVHRIGQKHSWKHDRFALYCSVFVAGWTTMIFLGHVTSLHATGHCSEAQRIFRRTTGRGFGD